MKQKNNIQCCLIFALMLFCSISSVFGQNKKHDRFDPKRFMIELEQFITTQAGLTPAEAANFFPVYREMMDKQRIIFDEIRRIQMVDTRDDKTCAEIIRKQDELDIEIKIIQQQYHTRFLLILPAGKLMKVIKAETQFHRQAFRRMQAHKSRPRKGIK